MQSGNQGERGRQGMMEYWNNGMMELAAATFS